MRNIKFIKTPKRNLKRYADGTDEMVSLRSLEEATMLQRMQQQQALHEAAPWAYKSPYVSYGEPQDSRYDEYAPAPNKLKNEFRYPFILNPAPLYTQENMMRRPDIVPYDDWGSGVAVGSGKRKRKGKKQDRDINPVVEAVNPDEIYEDAQSPDGAKGPVLMPHHYRSLTEQQYLDLPRTSYQNATQTAMPMTHTVDAKGQTWSTPAIAKRLSDIQNPLDVAQKLLKFGDNDVLRDEQGRPITQELYEVDIRPQKENTTRSAKLAAKHASEMSNDALAKEQFDIQNEQNNIRRAMNQAGAMYAPYAFGLFNPLGFASALIGGETVDELTKELNSENPFSDPSQNQYTYQGWADWLSDKTGLDERITGLLNPGYLLGAWTQIKAGPKAKFKFKSNLVGDDFEEFGSGVSDKFKIDDKTPLVPNVGFSYAGTTKAIDYVDEDGVPHYKDIHTTQAPSIRRAIFGDKNNVGYVKYRDKNGLLQSRATQQYTWDGVPLQERTAVGKKLDSAVHDAKVKVFGKDGDLKSLVKESIGDNFSTVRESVDKLLDKVFGEDIDAKAKNRILESADRHSMSEFVDAEGNVNTEAFSKFLEGVVDEAKLVEKNMKKKTNYLPTGMLPANGTVPTTAKEYIEAIVNRQYRAKPGHGIKSTNLYEHTFDVAHSAKSIPLPEGVSRQELVFAALMHDIGKVFAKEQHGQISAKLIGNRFSNIGDNVIAAIDDHMSTELYEGDPFTKALHFADVARGLEYDEAAAAFPDLLNYDRTLPTTPSLNSKFGSVKEQIEKQINPIFEQYGYDPIDTTLSEEDMLAQYRATVERHRTLLRGVNDPGEPVAPDDSKLVHGSPEWYTAHMKYELQKEVAETLRLRGLPNTAENRLQVAAEVIPKNPTPNGRKGMYKRHKDPQKKQILYAKATSKGKRARLGDKLGLRPDRDQGAYVATDKSVAELYAADKDGGKVGTGRAAEGGVFKVTKPVHELKPGQTLGENWLENDYAAYGSRELYANRRPLHDTYMYDNPYRVQTGRSLESDMRLYDKDFPKSGSKEDQRAYLSNYRNKIKFMRQRGVKPAYDLPGFNNDMWFDDRVYTSKKTNHPHLGSSVKNEGPRKKGQLRRPQYGHFVVKPGQKSFNAVRVDLSKPGSISKLMKQVTRKN